MLNNLTNFINTTKILYKAFTVYINNFRKIFCIGMNIRQLFKVKKFQEILENF